MPFFVSLAFSTSPAGAGGGVSWLGAVGSLLLYDGAVLTSDIGFGVVTNPSTPETGVEPSAGFIPSKL